jgi:hypothetical protein
MCRDQLPLARMVQEDGFRRVMGVPTEDIRPPHPAMLVRRLLARPGPTWRADDSPHLLAACGSGPGPICRPARIPPQRTTPATNAHPPVLGHASQEEGRLPLLEGTAGRQVASSFDHATFHKMAPAPGCVVWLAGQVPLEGDFSTTPWRLRVGWPAAGHQREATGTAVQHPVPIHPKMVAVGESTALPGSLSF